jgi:RsiW-degrading membrane proteinase PrsW (M82 family)
MLFFLVSGAIISVPFALTFESLTFLNTVLDVSAFLSIAVLAPLIEEFGKAYPLFFRHGETKKSMMTLGFLVGLGFGITEFFEYVLISHVFFVFRLPGLFFHAFTSSIVGYGIANKKPVPFYLLAVSLHFSFNAVILFGTYELLLLIAVFFVSLYLFISLYLRTPEEFIPY